MEADVHSANEVSRLLRAGQPESATRILLTHFGKRLFSFFRSKVNSETDAEDLVQETFIKLLRSDFAYANQPIGLIWSTAKSVHADWYRQKFAEKRGVSLTDSSVQYDDDGEQFSLTDSVEALVSEPWVRSCIEKGLELFTKQHSKEAIAIQIVFEGWSAEETAIYFGAKPPPSKKELDAARSRISAYMKKARTYFAHCRED
jgi:DNA-directed RNA polymerase specialized sigma24 family protein